MSFRELRGISNLQTLDKLTTLRFDNNAIAKVRSPLRQRTALACATDDDAD